LRQRHSFCSCRSCPPRTCHFSASDLKSLDCIPPLLLTPAPPTDENTTPLGTARLRRLIRSQIAVRRSQPQHYRSTRSGNLDAQRLTPPPLSLAIRTLLLSLFLRPYLSIITPSLVTRTITSTLLVLLLPLAPSPLIFPSRASPLSPRSSRKARSLRV
jgi:hypothetical protein